MVCGGQIELAKPERLVLEAMTVKVQASFNRCEAILISCDTDLIRCEASLRRWQYFNNLEQKHQRSSTCPRNQEKQDKKEEG